MFANSTGLGSLQHIADALENAGPAQPMSQRDALMMTLRGLGRAGGRGAPQSESGREFSGRYSTSDRPIYNPREGERPPGDSRKQMRDLMDRLAGSMGQINRAPAISGPGLPQPGGPRQLPAGGSPPDTWHRGTDTPGVRGPEGDIAGLLQGLQNLMQQRGQGAQTGAQAGAQGVATDDVLARRRAQRQGMMQTMQNLPRGR